MWQRFTERARRVILLAQAEAGKMNSSHVGTEHLLLGLVLEKEGVAAQILAKMGIGHQIVSLEIRQEHGEVEKTFGSEPKLTPRAKRVLELAADEGRKMHHNYIGTEHLLIALLREKDGIAANVLRKLGLNLEKAQQLVEEYHGPETEEKAPPERRTFVVKEEVEAQQRAVKERLKRRESLDWMLPMMTRLLPRELRDMGRELRNLHKQKEIAVLYDDYETAAILRDEANALEKRMEEFADEWEAKLNEDSWDESRDTLSFVVQSLISSVDAAIEALSANDEAKIAEIKERLQGLLAATRPAEKSEDQPKEQTDDSEKSADGA